MSRSRPNIIFIMTDQQQARACRREGFDLDTTPTLDRMGEEGVWFDRGYTAAPICLPARVSSLTGRFPSATYCQTNTQGKYCCASTNIPDWLREQAGYITARIGKNHSHLGPDNFDHHFPFGHNGDASGETHKTEEEAACDNWLKNLKHGVATEPAPFSTQATPPARAVSEACRWIDEVKGQPFFMWLSIPEPHNPYYAPEPYFSLFDPESLPAPLPRREGTPRDQDFGYLEKIERYAFPDLEELLPRYRSNYYGMLRLIDDQIARLREHLQQTGHWDNTFVIYVSDHGDFVGDYGLMRKGAGITESLMRIPFVCSGGLVASQGRHDAHVSLVDIFPTLCEAADVPFPPDIQGRSLWPIVQNAAYSEAEFANISAEQGFGGMSWTEEEAKSPAQVCEDYRKISFNELNPVTQSGIARMLRQNDWKLVLYENGLGEMFNLASDPGEQNNRFNAPECATIQSELVLELARRLTQFQPANPNMSRDACIKQPPHNWYR